MRRLAALSLVASLTLGLTACPSTPPEGDPSISPTVSPTDDLEPVSGGTLVVSVRDLTLDPARVGGPGGLGVVAQVFDPLTAIEPGSNRVVPAAAKRWSVSRDGLTWRFQLARRAYHDGTLVRAADFERAFDRITRKSTDADAAFLLEHVVGFRLSHDANARTLQGVSAPQPDVLTIKLQRPFAELPYHLAHPALGPLASRYRRSLKGFASRPIGNGPFRVARASRTLVTLGRFDAYTPAPYLDRVQFRLVRDVDDGWSSYLRAEADVTEVPPSAVNASGTLFDEDGFTPSWAAMYFGLNLQERTYAKPIVRRAISMAIDREAIAETIYGGTRDPATGIIPRGVRGFVPDACGACVHDAERASAILDAAFPRRKPAVTVDFLGGDAASRRVARAIANDLNEVGLRAGLRAHGEAGYVPALAGGRTDIAQLAWVWDVPSPDVYLAHLLRSGSVDNFTGFRDRGFDRLLDDARKERNGARRLALYRKAEARALAAMPLIPIVFYRNRVAIAERVHDLILDGAGIFDAGRVWVEPR